MSGIGGARDPDRLRTAPEEELRTGGPSPRSVRVVAATALAIAALVAVLLLRNSAGNHRGATPTTTVSTPSVSAQNGSDLLTIGNWMRYEVGDIVHDMRYVTVSAELINGATLSLSVEYPINVSGPGIGANVHIVTAVIAADDSQASLPAPPPALSRIRRSSHVEIWIRLRLSCLPAGTPRTSAASLTVNVPLAGVAFPATFSLADLASGTGPLPFSRC